MGWVISRYYRLTRKWIWGIVGSVGKGQLGWPLESADKVVQPGHLELITLPLASELHPPQPTRQGLCRELPAMVPSGSLRSVVAPQWRDPHGAKGIREFDSLGGLWLTKPILDPSTSLAGRHLRGGGFGGPLITLREGVKC